MGLLTDASLTWHSRHDDDEHATTIAVTLVACVLRDIATAFPSGSFGLVCAFDIVEHVADDRHILRELSRGAAIVVSVPLHREQRSVFDGLVGHMRRYDPDALAAMLRAHRLEIERSATFGSAAESPAAASRGGAGDDRSGTGR